MSEFSNLKLLIYSKNNQNWQWLQIDNVRSQKYKYFVLKFNNFISIIAGCPIRCSETCWKMFL